MSSYLYNSSSDSCNEKLLNAVRAENIDEVERQLQNPNIDVNYDVGDGDTVLFTSLFCKNLAIFECLVNAGFDIDFRNALQETPLHTAVISSHISFVHALIKRGADINAKNQYNYAPLNHAILHEKVDALCMLLYYDAGINTVCTKNMTPFTWALGTKNFEIANILLDFYDDFSWKNNYGETALQLAAMYHNPLCIEICKKSTNKNECFSTLLLHSLDYQNAELFKLLWSKHKEDICLQVDLFNSNLLLSLLSYCEFTNSDWFDCLYLLFSSPIICTNLHGCEWGWTKKPFLANLIIAFYGREIDLHHRMILINLCLSCGINVGTYDINLAYLLYGFNEEMETFVHTLNYQQTIIPKDFLPLPRFIFVLEDNYKFETVSPIFEIMRKGGIVLEDAIEQDIIVKSLGFTSMSPVQKQTITNVCMEHYEDHGRIIEKLDAIPEMPSLLELCRNQIRQQYSGVKSYQFHTKINELKLPPYLKDVVRFKTALY